MSAEHIYSMYNLMAVLHYIIYIIYITTPKAYPESLLANTFWSTTLTTYALRETQGKYVTVFTQLL